jgi:DNA-binding NarL/FixJ family response regulator
MKKASSNQKNDSQTTAVAELGDIKALLVLLLMKSGASQTEIAGALGINQATVSRQFKFGTVKPLSAKTISTDTGK